MQSSTLQDIYCAGSNDLASDLPGIGSGWQQSKQDWRLLAVMGEHI